MSNKLKFTSKHYNISFDNADVAMNPLEIYKPFIRIVKNPNNEYKNDLTLRVFFLSKKSTVVTDSSSISKDGKQFNLELKIKKPTQVAVEESYQLTDIEIDNRDNDLAKDFFYRKKLLWLINTPKYINVKLVNDETDAVMGFMRTSNTGGGGSHDDHPLLDDDYDY